MCSIDVVESERAELHVAECESLYQLGAADLAGWAMELAGLAPIASRHSVAVAESRMRSADAPTSKAESAGIGLDSHDQAVIHHSPLGDPLIVSYVEYHGVWQTAEKEVLRLVRSRTAGRIVRRPCSAHRQRNAWQWASEQLGADGMNQNGLGFAASEVVDSVGSVVPDLAASTAAETGLEVRTKAEPWLGAAVSVDRVSVATPP